MNKLTRRLCLMAVPLALAGVAASPSLAQQLSLGQVSTYLNSFTSAEGEFTQINADGTISTGTIYIKRPGRVRFEYNPPEESLVVSGGGQVAIFDPRSDSGPDRYPLNQTPLSIILERNIDLTRTDMVTGHTSDGTTTTVTAQDPAHPEYGNIRMVFTSEPVELRQWIVTDDTGQQTTVILGDLAKDGRVPDILFNINREMRLWGN
ncbi:outer membrane lipoprotein carrier protein LolA [Octadecabacter sp. 1_MG-2023]|uniref:LolA family protein n=1 Tax=unclassified Octadecabacter TaxID=196158 RepID=UPI001C087A66|nr:MULTISPECIES: outer membrane lipoprotein carrier protein LolA [unclassified Octadecabacter]MBU2992145.1 outer membrane lipoprotein carrier protein LolA [Octadecabacter sp. B2R22]MDO6735099.1 outer membrane lipoprotein carrier protein LolA [Octadecabacter sp. 1_MG-2023]